MTTNLPFFPAPRRLLTPPVVFFLLVLAGYVGFVLLPVLRQWLGMAQSPMWFLDTHAVLAACDAVRAGLDPFQPNPLDVYHRPHVYSSWWFSLGRFGLTREDNFLVGGLWVMVFFAMVFALLRPRSYRAAVWYALLVLSPPVLLAVLRANNDLVIFVLLGTGVLVMRRATPWRLALFALSLTLATGLKYYPLVGGLALVLLRPPRLMHLTAGLTLLVAGLALTTVLGDLRRVGIPAPDGLYTLGTPVLFHELDWPPWAVLCAGAILLTGVATACWWRGWFVRLDNEKTDWRERVAFACGSAVLVGCFLAGSSYAYRLIFMLFLAPFVWRCAATTARIWPVLLVLGALWMDGIYCLVGNFPLSPSWLRAALNHPWCWRLISQPVIWTVMALLTASLFEMLRVAWADWRGKIPLVS